MKYGCYEMLEAVFIKLIWRFDTTCLRLVKGCVLSKHVLLLVYYFCFIFCYFFVIFLLVVACFYFVVAVVCNYDENIKCLRFYLLPVCCVVFASISVVVVLWLVILLLLVKVGAINSAKNKRTSTIFKKKINRNKKSKSK